MADATHATDVSRPAALPTANLPNRNLSATQSNLTAYAHLDASEYLDAVQEDLNKRVDSEIDILVDGMVDLVEISSVGDKDKFRIAQESFQVEMRAESMIRAAHSLLALTHSLKLMHLLSDEAQAIQLRDKELRQAQEETEVYKDKVAEHLNELLKSTE